MKQGDKNSLPNGWEMKTLGEVAKVMYGYTEKSYIEEIGPKFLRITDIQNDGVNWDTVPYCYINDSDFEKYKLINGDIVFARTGATTGKSYLVINPPKSVFASYLIKLNIINIDLLPEFLFLYFQTKAYWDTINAGISGSAQGGFNATKLSELQIPFPPKEEQQRIVAKLDEAFEAIEKAKANAEQNLKNAKELFDSYLQAIFENKGKDWEKKTLSEIADIKGGKRVPKGYCLETKSTGYPYIRVTDFNDEGGVDLKDIHYISKEVYEQIRNYTITTNDLYISIAGTIGKSGIIPNELNNANLTENACKLVFNIKLEPKFIYYFTKTEDFAKQASLNTRVAAMPKLALTRLSTITLNIPNSIYEQQSIVQKLDALSAETKKLEAIYLKKLEDLEELKKSILQKAFSGQL